MVRLNLTDIWMNRQTSQYYIHKYFAILFHTTYTASCLSLCMFVWVYFCIYILNYNVYIPWPRPLRLQQYTKTNIFTSQSGARTPTTRRASQSHASRPHRSNFSIGRCACVWLLNETYIKQCARQGQQTAAAAQVEWENQCARERDDEMVELMQEQNRSDNGWGCIGDVLGRILFWKLFFSL